MIYIAKRGNINGPNHEKENHPDYLKDALNKGYHAELDVWCVDGKFILGHDKPQYEVSKGFLSHSKLWCHAKDIATLHSLARTGNFIHYFFHQQDDATLTSRKWVWTYPGKSSNYPMAIVVSPELAPPGFVFDKASGICSDYIEKYKSTKI